MNYNFYLVDDDISVLSILSKIIVNQNLGDVIGKSINGEQAMEDIKRLKPDIVIVDLLLPAIDGIKLVSQLKPLFPEMPFIMVSEVFAKDMVSKAYNVGVEFYINKPINVIEVKNVITRIDEKMRLKQVVSSFQSAFQSIQNVNDLTQKAEKDKQVPLDEAKEILSQLGVLSEAGVSDILNLVSFISENDTLRIMDAKLSDLYNFLRDKYEKERGEIVNEKAIEQRIRRTIGQAFENICELGVENYGHLYFERYATTLFDFKEVRKEMDYIRQLGFERGKINIRKFLTGLLDEMGRY